MLGMSEPPPASAKDKEKVFRPPFQVVDSYPGGGHKNPGRRVLGPDRRECMFLAKGYESESCLQRLLAATHHVDALGQVDGMAASLVNLTAAHVVNLQRQSLRIA